MLFANGVKGEEDGDPISYSLEDGFALCKISETGLAYVLSHIADFPSDHHADLRKLASFVKEHGTAHIYEYATS